jgi:hypothetical protein
MTIWINTLKIKMKTILKDYIGHVESPNPHGTVSYLEPVFKAQEGGYGTLSMKSNISFIEASTRRVSSIWDKETMQDIQALHGENGVDPSSMVRSVLENVLETEMEMTIEKEILTEMRSEADRNWREGWTKFQTLANRWFGYEPKMTWQERDGSLLRSLVITANLMLSKTRTGGIPFVIVNGAVGMWIQDLPEFIYAESSVIHRSGGACVVGNLMGRIQVIVDPYLSFNERKIVMGIKPDVITNARIFMLENPDAKLTFDDSYDGSLNVKNILTKRYGIKTIPSQSYLTINFAEPGKKHNLFTHLISKIFKK